MEDRRLTDRRRIIGNIDDPGTGGRRREGDVCEVMNGVLYVLETGCQRRALPKNLPPKSTVHDYLMLWDRGGRLERVHHALYLLSRVLEGREASSSAGVIDNQSVKSTEMGGAFGAAGAPKEVVARG